MDAALTRSAPSPPDRFRSRRFSPATPGLSLLVRVRRLRRASRPALEMSRPHTQNESPAIVWKSRGDYFHPNSRKGSGRGEVCTSPSRPASHMPIIAIANQKGGVGKTTTAVNLAAGLSVAGYTVCLIDCDPQANASTSVYNRDEITITLTDVVCARFDYSNPHRPTRFPFAKIEDAIYETEFERLDLVPSNLGLAQFDRESAVAIDRLVEAIETLSRQYDFLILDTPPNLGLLFTAALKSASYVIIPVAAQYLPLEGVGDLLISLDELIKRRKLTVLGALVTLFDTRTTLSKDAREKIENDPTLGPKLFAATITINTKLAEAPAYHVPIYYLTPVAVGVTRAIQQFDELVTEVLTRLSMPFQKTVLREVVK
jgi:chromosome partitioning protein